MIEIKKDKENQNEIIYTWFSANLMLSFDSV